MTGFNAIEKQQNHVFWLQVLLTSSLQNQQLTLSQPRSDFFLLIHFLGRATAFCSSASWPCLNFQHHNCIACWENCMPEFLTVFVPSPLFFSYLYLYLSTATPTSHGNFVLLVIFSCSPGLSDTTFFARWAPLSTVTTESLNPVDCLQFLYTENYLKLLNVSVVNGLIWNCLESC